MSGAAFLRIKKLKGGNIIAFAARHNKRELFEAGSIDPGRSPLNEVISGPRTADEVAQLAKALMATAGIAKPRKDATTAIEIIFSLPPNHQIDERAYFADCASWAANQFGGLANILSVDIHRDEGAPHCHILILPLINRRLNGGKLVLPYRVLQNLFHAAVAARFGLRKAPAGLQGASKQVAATLVLETLRTTSDPALQSAAWATIRDTIEQDPAPWLPVLGIASPSAKSKPTKTMAQIFTGTGKGGKTNREQETASTSIDFQSEPLSIDFDQQETDRSLCSVDFQISTVSLATQATTLQRHPAPASDRLEVARQAVDAAIAKHARLRPTLNPNNKQATVDGGGYRRVRDGEPLPMDW